VTVKLNKVIPALAATTIEFENPNLVQPNLEKILVTNDEFIGVSSGGPTVKVEFDLEILNGTPNNATHDIKISTGHGFTHHNPTIVRPAIRLIGAEAPA
jgi:hypothetical protein